MIKDTIKNVLDTLEKHPIMKGVVPSGVGVGFSYMDISLPYLQYATLVLSFIIACLTLYVKVKEIFFKKEK